MTKPLPKGQIKYDIFPRFGLSQYANRFPSETNKIELQLGGDLSEEVKISEELKQLDLVEQVSDFHCVTTWTKQDCEWRGYKFQDFYNQLVKSKVEENKSISHVVLHAQDGYKTSLLLNDLMSEDVMLATHLGGEKLCIAHGAPIRIVAPGHYGYKNLKHIKRLEFYEAKQKVKQGYLKFMDHPRARVSHEERASGGPGWFFRYLYRPLIGGTAKEFAKALEKYEKEKAE